MRFLTVKWVSPLFGGYTGTRGASDTALYGSQPMVYRFGGIRLTKISAIPRGAKGVKVKSMPANVAAMAALVYALRTQRN